MIFQMVYVSKAAEDLSAHDCEDIIASSQRNNAQDGLTGGLLLCDGWFVQVLEGAVGSVNAVYQRIAGDPRHRYPVIIGAEYLQRRDFPDWKMRLISIRNVEDAVPIIRRYTPTTAFDPQGLTRMSAVELMKDLAQAQAS